MDPDDYDAMCVYVDGLVNDQLEHDASRRQLLKDELQEYLKGATQEQILEKLLENDAKLMDAYKNIANVLYPIRRAMEANRWRISEYNSNLYPTMTNFNTHYDEYLKLRSLQAGGHLVFYEDGNLDSISRHKAVIDDATQLIENLLEFFFREVREPGSIRNEYYNTYHRDNEHVLSILLAHLGGRKEIDHSDIRDFKYSHPFMRKNNIKIMDIVSLGVKKGVLKYEEDLSSLQS